MCDVCACVVQIHIIDIAPTIAHIMGLHLPNVEGRVLTEVFRT
jgi:hypothetical protein